MAEEVGEAGCFPFDVGVVEADVDAARHRGRRFAIDQDLVGVGGVRGAFAEVDVIAVGVEVLGDELPAVGLVGVDLFLEFRGDHEGFGVGPSGDEGFGGDHAGGDELGEVIGHFVAVFVGIDDAGLGDAGDVGGIDGAVGKFRRHDGRRRGNGARGRHGLGAHHVGDDERHHHHGVGAAHRTQLLTAEELGAWEGGEGFEVPAGVVGPGGGACGGELGEDAVERGQDAGLGVGAGEHVDEAEHLGDGAVAVGGGLGEVDELEAGGGGGGEAFAQGDEVFVIKDGRADRSVGIGRDPIGHRGHLVEGGGDGLGGKGDDEFAVLDDPGGADDEDVDVVDVEAADHGVLGGDVRLEQPTGRGPAMALAAFSAASMDLARRSAFLGWLIMTRPVMPLPATVGAV